MNFFFECSSKWATKTKPNSFVRIELIRISLLPDAIKRPMTSYMNMRCIVQYASCKTDSWNTLNFRTKKMYMYLTDIKEKYKCWFRISTSVVNYGILFNMEKLSGSIYLTNIFFGVRSFSLLAWKPGFVFYQKWA